MSIETQIQDYLNSQPPAKRNDMQALHSIILDLMPDCKWWFLDGKNNEGKVVSNPNIGYGVQTMQYADGSAREFYQIGMSANTTGISIYILGIKDKNYLSVHFGDTIGKASVTGYCIKFKALKDINVEVLKAAILAGVGM